ncbi:hypothetical protein HMPREF3032_01533 [Veillonella sp. DNF00869]|nr:hypothetical protein HMPREF3032_01533 [Veillonella sp. DNF00869]
MGNREKVFCYILTKVWIDPIGVKRYVLEDGLDTNNEDEMETV